VDNVLVVLVTSRSYDEYVAMFALGSRELSGRVLDCSAGAAEFAAVASAAARHVVAVDPAYALPRSALADRTREDLDRGNAIAADFPDRFTWRWHGSPQRRTAVRQRAMARFVTDVIVSPRRYVAGQLPQLPFRPGSFDLALCSHLLFTWADQLGRDWHAAAVVELARVAAEVRIFPTVVQGAGEPVPFWDALMGDLERAGLDARLRTVEYEFQVGADQMLVVTSASA
jgi:SAM-dependent methyltransferase